MTPARFLTILPAVIFAASCSVGPNYVKPSTPAPPQFKEQPPNSFKEIKGWKVGEPKDNLLRGKWWEIFGDSDLDALEEQVGPANQTLAQAEAQYRASVATVRVARAALYPTVTTSPAVTGTVGSEHRGAFPIITAPAADLLIPFSASWTADLYGQIHRTIASNAASAQSSKANLESARLLAQSELALDYFQLHGLDAEKQLLDATVTAYEKAVQLTVNRYNQGVVSQVDVAQAQTQVEQTRAQATDTQVQRQQLEHAIAILLGRPPSEFSIAVSPIKVEPPAIPFGVPSELLERRPDIAQNERQVAAANEQIGIAMAAFYPTLTLNASAGLEGSTLLNLFTWPSRFWSLGPTLSEILFDKGKRQGLTEQAVANYDATVAAYRQSVLTALQQVEDNLAALRILDDESKQQAAAVGYAERSLELANNQYNGGITTYLQVITAQTIALSNEVTAVELKTRRMMASVSLIQALGGGWSASDLPSREDVTPTNSKGVAFKPVARN